MSEAEPEGASRRAATVTVAETRGATSQRLQTVVVGELAIRLANLVIEACARRGVVLMPLKGVLLLSRWPELRGERDLVDIDFLVRSPDIQEVAPALQMLGFEATAHSTAATTFTSDSWPLSIDVHRDLFPHGLFRMATEQTFSRAEVDASLFVAPIARMSDPDLFAHLIGHFVKGRGAFVEDTSLDDIRWLLKQGIWEDASGLGAHLRALGLRRAAAYVLAHPAFRDARVPQVVLRSLELSAPDHLAIATARLVTKANGGVPPWWMPHLLDATLPAGSRSLWLHLDEAGRRRAASVTKLRGPRHRARSD